VLDDNSIGIYIVFTQQFSCLMAVDRDLQKKTRTELLAGKYELFYVIFKHGDGMMIPNDMHIFLGG